MLLLTASRLLPLAVALLCFNRSYTFACQAAVYAPREFPVVDVHSCSGSSSYILGRAIGEVTTTLMHARFEASKGLQECIAFAATPDGRRAVAAMLQLHAAHYPEYVEELRGLADGAGLPFEQVLMANMRQELLALAKPHQQQQADSCTDVLLSLPAAHGPPMQQPHSHSVQPPTTTLVGHNEDMTRDAVGRIYFVRYNAHSSMQANSPSATNQRSSSNTSSSSSSSSRRGSSSSDTRSRSSRSSSRRLTLAAPHQQLANSNMQQRRAAAAHPQTPTAASKHSAINRSSSNVSWLGFVYAGELASSGFGINSAGVGFSLNAVFPAAPVVPGFSRNFVSRQLLQARSIDEALDVISTPGQAVGHSYNLFDIHSKRLLNVEVGPGGASSVLEVTRGSFYFHANMFKHLVVQQHVDNSSYHREARALQLQSPGDVNELLRMLGDTADADYPIFRHGNSTADSAIVTLCTALFDLDAGTMRVWTGNPGQARTRRLQLQFNLHTLQLLPIAEEV